MKTIFSIISPRASSAPDAANNAKQTELPAPNKEDLNDSRKNLGAPDWFRLAAAVLIITIHTSPLVGINNYANLFLTGVAARIAVPFFFAVSGYFADFSTASGLKKIVFKTAVLYGIATLIYLPIYTDYPELKPTLFGGIFYHLWFLPACAVGAAVVYLLKKLPVTESMTFFIVTVLYIIGVFGDGWYRFISVNELLHKFYDVLFKVFPYTRNGIFMAPIFMLYGNTLSSRPQIKRRLRLVLGLIASIALLTAERFLLRGFVHPPHNNMFIFLIPSTFFLLQLLISFKVKPRPFLRPMSMWIYIIHPLIIHYVHKSGIEDHLETAVITTVISFPLAAAISAVTSILKRTAAKAEQ